MSLSYTVNFYDTRSLDWRNKLIGLFSNSSITHVGLQVDNGKESIEYTCIEKHKGLRIIKPEVFSKLCCPPVDSIKLGIVDKTLPSVPDSYKLTGRSLLFYHLIGKHLGIDTPNGCCVFVSEALVNLGLLERKIFYPAQLYKELKKCR